MGDINEMYDIDETDDIKEKKKAIAYNGNITACSLLDFIGIIGAVIGILCLLNFFLVGLVGVIIFFSSIICLALSRLIRNSLIQNAILYELLNKSDK